MLSFFRFVKFTEETAAKNAIVELNKTPFQGSRLNVCVMMMNHCAFSSIVTFYDVYCLYNPGF